MADGRGAGRRRDTPAYRRCTRSAALVRPGAAGGARPRSGGLAAGAMPDTMICRFIARRLVAADADRRAGRADAGPPGPARIVSRIPPRGARRHPRGRRGPQAGRGCRRAGRRRSRDLAEPATTRVKAKAAALGLLFGDRQGRGGLRSRRRGPDRAADRGSSPCRTWSSAAPPGSPPSSSGCWMTRRCAGRRSARWRPTTTPRRPRRSSDRYREPFARPSATTRSPRWRRGRRGHRRCWMRSATGPIPRRDVSTTIARQILAFGDPELTAALEQSGAVLRPTARDKTPLIAKYKSDPGRSPTSRRPTPTAAAPCSAGCAASATSSSIKGATSGPDLTGSDRANADYILENVLDPSASVGRDYTLTTVATPTAAWSPASSASRRRPRSVIQTASERITVPREDVEAIKASNDLDDAGRAARTAHAAGDPRPVRLPGDSTAGAARRR